MNVCAQSLKVEIPRRTAVRAGRRRDGVAPVPGITGITAAYAGLGEDLNSIVLTITDVHQSIIASDNAVRMPAIAGPELVRVV
jgi:hypothetical protein